jgi:hypothetical protein
MFGVLLTDHSKFLNAMVYTKLVGYFLWLFHLIVFLVTQLRKYLLVKNEDCTLLFRSSFDNPMFKKHIDKALDLKYSLCQICLEKGSLMQRSASSTSVATFTLAKTVGSVTRTRTTSRSACTVKW